MLYDWGVHLIDQARNSYPSYSVTAQLFSVHAQEVDDNFKPLGFESGVQLIEVATTLSQAPRWHVSGEVGTVVIQDWRHDGRIVKLAEDQEFTGTRYHLTQQGYPPWRPGPRKPVEYPLLKDAHECVPPVVICGHLLPQPSGCYSREG